MQVQQMQIMMHNLQYPRSRSKSKRSSLSRYRDTLVALVVVEGRHIDIDIERETLYYIYETRVLRCKVRHAVYEQYALRANLNHLLNS